MSQSTSSLIQGFTNAPPSYGVQQGFSLAELAIVLLIVGLILAGVLTPLGAQIEIRKTAETTKILEDVKEALLGFAAANGRLPCPASDTSNGQESFCTTGAMPCPIANRTTTYQATG